MLNPMLYAIKANILWHKYEREIVSNETESSQGPFFNNKINNQWRDQIKQLMTFYSRTKKLKKLHYGDLNEIVLKTFS